MNPIHHPGAVSMNFRDKSPALALAAWLALGAGGARAADLSDAQKGFVAVGPSTSDAAALREAQTPSPAYRAGAALAAWRNATASLDYDVKNPSGDGVDGAVSLDCFDEKAAFADLDATRQALGVSPAAITAQAGLTDPLVAKAWVARQAGAPSACR
jgi:hypothetical protein